MQNICEDFGIPLLGDLSKLAIGLKSLTSQHRHNKIFFVIFRRQVLVGMAPLMTILQKTNFSHNVQRLADVKKIAKFIVNSIYQYVLYRKMEILI